MTDDELTRVSETPDPEPAPGEVGGRNLPVAIAVGVALAVTFLLTIFTSPAAFAILVGALCAMAYVEAGRVLRAVGRPVEIPVLIVATAVMLIGAYQAGQAGQVIGLIVLFLGGAVWLIADHTRVEVVRAFANTQLFGLWVGFLASFAVLLAVRPDGTQATLGVIVPAIVADIGGYVFGVSFGRRPVAPSISPKKTWEGLAGGILAAMVVNAAVMPLLGDLFTWSTAALVALAVGFAGFFGDLTESMIKRDLGVKDLGALLPGHGGVLDRVDGILLALPVGFYALELVA